MTESTPRSKKFQEFTELLEIPALEEFFLNQLDEVKIKFRDQIEAYRNQKNNQISGREGTPTFRDGESLNKSYFFELNRSDDIESESGYKWKLEQFKLKAKQEIIDMIFSEFIGKLDTFEIAPSLIQKKTVKAFELKKAFEINFMKSSDRVVGFVKEIEDPAEALKKDNSPMVRVATNYQNIDKKEMYKKIIALMDKDPEVREDIFFYFHMLQKALE